MKWTSIFILGLIIWLMQLLLADILSIDSVRPDFCVLLILYWSVIYGRTMGIISGFIFGLIVDLSGAGLFFGLSSLTYTITGYFSGILGNVYSKINPMYFSISWVFILLFQFFIYCIVQYQGLWELDFKLFFGKWIGTSIYTLSFAGIFQFIFPLNRLVYVKS
tara:strand:- start:92 stop:580 length:489 start_codon:yes stop_codon:yes gene_type:complete